MNYQRVYRCYPIQHNAQANRCPDCYFLRHLIEASWNVTLYNPTDVQKFQQSKIPFRSYCDTFQDFTYESGRECDDVSVILAMFARTMAMLHRTMH